MYSTVIGDDYDFVWNAEWEWVEFNAPLDTIQVILEAEFEMQKLLFMLVWFVNSVEHLQQPVLSQLPNSIFGHIAPDVVVMTTPNAEFNVLFPNLTGFRHHDHKFEWTRQQFEDWLVDSIFAARALSQTPLESLERFPRPLAGFNWACF